MCVRRNHIILGAVLLQKDMHLLQLRKRLRATTVRVLGHWREYVVKNETFSPLIMCRLFSCRDTQYIVPKHLCSES